jgi:hypothetical protein
MLPRYRGPAWAEGWRAVSEYDTAQICMNGHLINEMASRYPEHNLKSCSKCGAETITACPQCRQSIRGFYHIEGVIGGSPVDVPAFCHGCGRPYPWTQAALQAARELTYETMTLSEDEKALLMKSLHEIVADTPNTPIAAARVKRLLAKAGPEIGAALKQVVTTVASEAAKKILFGQAN